MAAPSVGHSLFAVTGGVSREPLPAPDGAVLTEKLGSGSYATVYKGYRRVCVAIGQEYVYTLLCCFNFT